MADNSNIEQNQKAARSAAYPAFTIEESIAFIIQIRKSFPTSPFKREDITAILKKAAIHRDIAAAAQYGLVDRKDDTYKLSDRIQQIINYLDENEKKEALLTCFSSPKLYQELIERFKGHAVPPDQQLRAILQRFHNITESAAPQAASVFIENAIYVGALDDHRILLGESFKEQSTKVDTSSFGDNVDNNSQAKPVDIAQKNNSGAAPLLLEQMNGSIDLKIHLTEKKIAHLIYPDSVNEKDIQILKLQLEALALTL